MLVDVLVAEIGSTTTVVNAFDKMHTSSPVFLGQGQAYTTVLDGDVTIGLQNALLNLEKKLGEKLNYKEMYATSSAAGGLKMTVHGLVYDMTVKAAKEAALGAGAVIHLITAGEISSQNLAKIKNIKPNILLLAGGVDYGEKKTALQNAHHLASLGLKIPVIYAGNIDAREEVEEIFQAVGIKVICVENVYPSIDQLNIEPTRKAIQKLFEEHIVSAPGMDKIRNLVNKSIVPTPGSVMNCAVFLQEYLGNLLVLDVGGATTDVHSVSEDSDTIKKILLSPEPKAKRTVEGDLGVYVNAPNVAQLVDWESRKDTIFNPQEMLEKRKPIPITEEEVKFMEILTETAVDTALKRHVGRIKYLYGPTGRITMAQGKDLTNVRWIIGTGGALTRLKRGGEILKHIERYTAKGGELMPKKAQILLDNDYIMSSLGVLTEEYSAGVFTLLQKSLSWSEI